VKPPLAAYEKSLELDPSDDTAKHEVAEIEAKLPTGGKK
jgi:hypothetical protein